MAIFLFDDLQSLFDHMDAQVERHNKLVTPWQASLKPGDRFRVVVEGEEDTLVEVLDPVAEAGDDEDALEEAAVYKEPHMTHFRFCRLVNRHYPNGIKQDLHVSLAAAIPSNKLFG